MFQIVIKSPAWELEEDLGDRIQYSARNSGCADFITIPKSVAPNAERLLRKGLLVKCDEWGRFVEALPDYDKELPLHG